MEKPERCGEQELLSLNEVIEKYTNLLERLWQSTLQMREKILSACKFFKDHKNTLLMIFLIASIALISSLSYKTYNTSQNAKAGEIYDAWFSSISTEAPLKVR